MNIEQGMSKSEVKSRRDALARMNAAQQALRRAHVADANHGLASAAISISPPRGESPAGARSWRTWRSSLAGLALLPVLLAGCNKEGSGDKYTLDSLIKKGIFKADESPVEQAKMAFEERDPDIRRSAIEKLSNNSWALREPYLKRFSQLTKPSEEIDPSVRAVSVRTLGRAGDRTYMPEMLAALNDPDPVVRWDACVVLDRLPDEKAVTRLRQMAIDPNETIDVRASAATALKHYREDNVYRTLLRSLDDNDFTVRSAAHQSLVAMTGRDLGYDPMKWSADPDDVGRETLPEPEVRYRKRPWWDWMKVTAETDAAPARADWDRPWWDWGGVTKPDDAPGATQQPGPAYVPTDTGAPVVGD
jgi:hypothetical protein